MPENAPGPVVIVGAGPGVGASVARRFGGEGHPVGLIARNRGRLEELAAELGADGIATAVATADVRRPDEVRRALEALAAELGPAQVLCVSPLPDVAAIKPVADTSAEDLAGALELGVVGAAAAVGQALPAMRERGGGTLLFTTGSAVLSPNPDRAASGIVNAAQAAYFKMLHEALGPEGIHVSHTVIVGAIGPGAKHEPADVAEHMWRRHVERDDAMTVIP
jgi:NADP-dependent 3-hydroxy acid dehydrogenase YdfG